MDKKIRKLGRAQVLKIYEMMKKSRKDIEAGNLDMDVILRMAENCVGEPVSLDTVRGLMKDMGMRRIEKKSTNGDKATRMDLEVVVDEFMRLCAKMGEQPSQNMLTLRERLRSANQAANAGGQKSAGLFPGSGGGQ